MSGYGKWIAVFAACGLIQTVQASDVALQQCRALKGDSERLKCYDSILLPAAGSNIKPVAVAPPKPADNTAAQNAKGSLGSSTNSADFGLPVTVPAAKVDKIQSTIVGRFGSWQQGTRIRLANGQVWQVTDDSRGICDCDNVKVEVTRGAFGTFFLEIEGKGNAPRVKRIQ